MTEVLSQDHESSLSFYKYVDEDVESLRANEATSLLPGPSTKPEVATQNHYTTPYHQRRRCGKEREYREPSTEALYENESGEDSEKEQSSSCKARQSRSRSAHSSALSPTIISEASPSSLDHNGKAMSGPQCSDTALSSRFPFLGAITLTLENKGSVARDHLASERTFLAYMRTSLAFASAGVALVQVFAAPSSSTPSNLHHRLDVYIRPLGAGTVAFGLFVLFIGVIRYFTVQAALTKGSFPVARLATGLIATMLTVLVTVTFAILLTGKLEARRK